MFDRTMLFSSFADFQQLLNPSRFSTEFSQRKARKIATTRIDFVIFHCFVFSVARTLLAFSRIVTYPRWKQRIPSTQSSFPEAEKPRYKACLHLKTAEEIPKNSITIHNQDCDEKFSFYFVSADIESRCRISRNDKVTFFLRNYLSKIYLVFFSFKPAFYIFFTLYRYTLFR